jgi:hypothetical protein
MNNVWRTRAKNAEVQILHNIPLQYCADICELQGMWNCVTEARPAEL